MKDRIAILTNFCENEKLLVEQGDDITERFNSHFEVFSILTFRDIFLNIPRDKNVNVYYSSPQNMFDLIGSPFNLISMNTKFNTDEFINRVVTLSNAIETSKFFCEKLLLSLNEIEELSNYKIGSIKMSENSFNSLCNLNNRNIDSFLCNTLKTLFILLKSKSVDDMLNIINEFLNVRYSHLYKQINVNKYAWRFYSFDPMLKSSVNLKTVPFKKEIMINLDHSFPQYNQNYILTMYWDTQFLYPFIMHILNKQFSKYKKLRDTYPEDVNIKKIKSIMKKIQFVSNLQFLDNTDEGTIKMFSTVYNYSFRTVQIAIGKTFIKPENEKLDDIMCGSFVDDDIFNNLDYNNEIVKYNNECLIHLISSLKTVQTILENFHEGEDENK